MKTRMLALTLVAGAIALPGAAPAQNVPAQFVVSGAAAEKIQDFTTINLATAQRVAEACEQIAEQVAPISITVWDNDGNEVYMDRMDGQDYINILTAEQKARTALADRASSKLRLNRALRDPMQEELRSYQLGEFPNSGGLPIVVNKQLIGVVGVGGAAPRPGFSDEICAHKALQQVIGPSVAPLVEDLPRDQQAPRERRNPQLPVPKFEVTMAPKTTLNPEWVVGGKGAVNIKDGNQISLFAAKAVAKACRDWAAAHDLGASIYILDVKGNLVHAERMDGQVHNNIRTAHMKAETALKIGEPTSAREARIRNDPGGAPRSAVWFNLFAQAGGMPIVVDGQTIGSIGVGGVVGGNDETCAVEGLKAVFSNRVALPVYPPAGNP
jgi:glc operon protein GlcG